MTNSPVEICNLALDYVGSKPIESFEDKDNKSSKLCKRWYDISRRAVLKDLQASFTIKRAVLAESVQVPVFGYAHSYKLPHDCLKMLSVNRRTDPQNYPIEGDSILCDIPEKIHIRYISDCTNISLYDDEFIECLALKIASNICIPLTQDFQKQQSLESRYRQKYIETSGKYASDNKIMIINRSRFRLAKFYDNPESLNILK